MVCGWRTRWSPDLAQLPRLAHQALAQRTETKIDAGRADRNEPNSTCMTLLQPGALRAFHIRTLLNPCGSSWMPRRIWYDPHQSGHKLANHHKWRYLFNTALNGLHLRSRSRSSAAIVSYSASSYVAFVVNRVVAGYGSRSGDPSSRTDRLR